MSAEVFTSVMGDEALDPYDQEMDDYLRSRLEQTVGATAFELLSRDAGSVIEAVEKTGVTRTGQDRYGNPDEHFTDVKPEPAKPKPQS